ncbi:hypothetical protein diail_3395 [Diaporthe ilicicola]|nr:hypothetical protein diail_3395 [Diaporthe ilicicola]
MDNNKTSEDTQIQDLDKVEEADRPIAAELPDGGLVVKVHKDKSNLITLPPKVRNKIYMMIIDEIRGIEEPPYQQVSLCQPPLAKVNRQLRREILPLWFSKKRFLVRICPDGFPDADRAWKTFLARFNALIGGVDGSFYLSLVNRLEFELTAPAIMTPTMADADPQATGVRLQFGPLQRQITKTWVMVGRPTSTDWGNRDEVRDSLVHSLWCELMAEMRGGLSWHGINWNSLDSDGEPDRDAILEPYIQIDRLVDLVMMVTAECSPMTRVVSVGFFPGHPL